MLEQVNLKIFEHTVPIINERIGIKIGLGKSNMTRLSYLASENVLRKLEVHLRHWNSSITLAADRKIINKVWAKLGINFILEILTKVFALKLTKNYHRLKFEESEYSQTVDVTGIYNVFVGRKECGGFPAHNGAFLKELKRTFTVLREKGVQYDQEFRAVAHIEYDLDSSNLTTLDFYDLCSNPETSPMKETAAKMTLIFNSLMDSLFDRFLKGYIVANEDNFIPTDLEEISATI